MVEEDETAAGGLPQIESWWPYLSIGARHAVLRAPAQPLDEHVRAEIERTTGTAVQDGTRLSRKDLAFVETQQESVD